MKKIAFIISTLLFLHTASSAQSLINSGFEAWDQSAGFEAAPGWFNINFLTQQGLPATTSPTPDAAHGSKAMLLETKAGGGGVILGYAAVGNQQIFQQGTFFQDQPVFLNFYYKAFPQAGDSAWVHLELKTTSGGQVVGDLDWYESDTVSTYQLMTIPINYKNTLSTTYLDLIFRSSYNDTFGIEGSQLIIDSVFFTDQSVVSIDEGQQTEVQVYPNPASDIINLQFTEAIGDVSIYNVTGERVLYKNIQAHEGQLPVGDLPKGVYTLHIQNKKGLITKKIALK